jgi:hypothetical protein
VIDWTNGKKIRELAWFDRGPLDETRAILGGAWSSYWYNGRIYSNEIQRSFDALKLTGLPGVLPLLTQRTAYLDRGRPGATRRPAVPA